MNLIDRTNDYERIINSDRTIDNPIPEKKKERSKMSRVLPFAIEMAVLLASLYGIGRLTEYIRTSFNQRNHAEQIYSRIEKTMADYDKDGKLIPSERETFLLRIIRGRAFVQNQGDLPTYADGRIVPIEDLAKMAQDYQTAHPNNK